MGLKCVGMSQAAPLLFKHSDVLAAIITSEVTRLQSEGKQCNGLETHQDQKGGETNMYGQSLSAIHMYLCSTCLVLTILFYPKGKTRKVVFPSTA